MTETTKRLFNHQVGSKVVKKKKKKVLGMLLPCSLKSHSRTVHHERPDRLLSKPVEEEKTLAEKCFALIRTLLCGIYAFWLQEG